jgi:hypothetical protein
VWPLAKARQWVLTFPHQTRFWLLRDPELFNEVITIVVDSISSFYERHRTLVPDQDPIYLPTAGSVSFVQFFGSSLSPNPHLHMMFLDGVFGRAKNGIKFFEHPGVCQESMFDVLEMIYERLSRLFAKRGCRISTIMYHSISSMMYQPISWIMYHRISGGMYQ